MARCIWIRNQSTGYERDDGTVRNRACPGTASGQAGLRSIRARLVRSIRARLVKGSIRARLDQFHIRAGHGCGCVRTVPGCSFGSFGFDSEKNRRTLADLCRRCCSICQPHLDTRENRDHRSRIQSRYGNQDDSGPDHGLDDRFRDEKAAHH